MARYADPERCPDCLGPIQYGALSCSACGLSLEGPLPTQLFQTLARADDLLVQMRTPAQAPVPVLVGAPAVSTAGGPPATPATIAPETGRAGGEPTPIVTGEVRHAVRLSGASVPKILLALGALCLLTAALVFLAVTWSVMGVAGRTATLLGFTAITGALAAWSARRNLRAAAETLSVVTLGLLGFDLFGARDAGWLGHITTPDFFVVLGAVLLAAGILAAMTVRRTPVGVLTGAEVIAALGLALAMAGAADADWLAFSAALTLGTVLTAAVVGAALRLRLKVLATAAGLVVGYLWLTLVTSSLVRAFEHPTAHELWLELEVWPLLAATALVGATAWLRTVPITARVMSTAAAELLLAVAALVPFTQRSMTDLSLAVVVVLVAALAVTWYANEPWVWGTALTTTLGAIWMLCAGLALTGAALARIGDAGGRTWSGTTDGALPAVVDVGLQPWLLPLVVVSLLAAGIVLELRLPRFDQVVAPAVGLDLGVALLLWSGVGTALLYPVPVWLIVTLLLLAASALLGWALRRQGLVPLTLGGTFLVGGMLTSFYDEWLTFAALLVGAVAAAAVLLRWREVTVAAAAGCVLTAMTAGLVWTIGALMSADGTWVAAVAVVVVAAMTLGIPALPASALASGEPRWSGIGVELGAAVAAFAVSVAGIDAATYAAAPTWAAVYLTLAGVGVSATALLRDDRRRAGWLGGLLLAAASWVRLWDVGVETPEAYTLPSAVALGVVGLAFLHRNPTAGTMQALSPCLVLGLVPSLLWVLWDPVTLRSTLLGLACLALLLGGVRLRWAAPVLLAGSVGAVLVIRLATPLAEAVPRWVLLGAAGALLIGLGITWERRLQEARAVLGYVRGLR